MLGHVAARREEQGRAPGCWNRVEMRPAILIRKEDDAVGGGPGEVRATIGRWYGAGERLRRFPQSLSCSRHHVGRPDLPRIRPRWQQRIGRAAHTGHPHERDASSVGRPARRAVARERRRKPGDRRRVVRIHADQSVIAAVHDEREPRAVRRPALLADLAAHGEQLLGRRGAVDRRGPDLAAFDEGDDIAAGRDHRLIAVADRLRVAAAPRHAEDLHFRRCRVRADVHRKPIVPVRAVITAAHIHDPLTVRGHRDAAQLLPVIAVVMRERSRGERRTLGDEDVAPALLVERPGDAGASGGGGKLGGEWVGPHLGQCEWGGPRGLSSRGGRENTEGG